MRVRPIVLSLNLFPVVRGAGCLLRWEGVAVLVLGPVGRLVGAAVGAELSAF